MNKCYSLLLLACLSLQALAAEDGLDVTIQLFTHAARTEATQGNSPSSPLEAVQDTETRVLPLYLRYRLEQSGVFGAVRVLPALDLGAELRISGEIAQSDGHKLDLLIKAADSSGVVWLDQHFSGAAVPVKVLSEDALAQDDFAGLFGEIVNALKSRAQQLSEREKATIRNVALLRYGAGLVPAAFTPYLESSSTTFSVKRMPSAEDTILTRISAIREREYQFIDVVDEEFRRFYAKAAPLYALWRQAQREQEESASARNAEALANAGGFRRGSYQALMQSYNNYRWVKLQELYVDELGEGFSNEINPTQLTLKDSVYRLSGSLEQQYRQWRTILAQLFALEQQ